MTVNVLVADDQSMVRAGFRLLLSGQPDITVVAEASNGLEAVEKAARFHPTVVLMDIRMPELDGLEATRRILAADKLARILILTTFDLDEYIYEALSAGASGFVLKDDPPEQLIAAIHTVAAGDALLSPAVTKRVIRQFTRAPRPTPPAGARRADRPRAGGLPPRRRRPLQSGDRAGALHQRHDRQDARDPRAAEAQPPRPRAGRRAGLPDRALRRGRPRAEPPRPEPDVDSGAVADSSVPIRILLVDDHTMVRSGLRLLLEEQDDFSVVAEAGDVDSAVAQTRTHGPKVILLDLNMPGQTEPARDPRAARSRAGIGGGRHDAARRPRVRARGADRGRERLRPQGGGAVGARGRGARRRRRPHLPEPEPRRRP